MSTYLTILVTGSPNETQAHLSALRFVKTALSMGEKIKSIFFYQEAVYVANRFVCKPGDETDLASQWSQIQQQYNIELQVCVAAANRRGILSAQEAAQNSFNEHSLNSAFSVLGLGQLVVAMSDKNNKLIQFK